MKVSLIALTVFFFFLIPFVKSDDQVFTEDFCGYNDNYLVLENFENGIGNWVNTTTTMEISNNTIAYNQSLNLTFNNALQINRTLPNINFDEWDSLTIWIWTNEGKEDGYNLRIFDNNSKFAHWDVTSNSNILRRKTLEINNSGVGKNGTTQAGFEWTNITLIQLRESNHDTFPMLVYIDDIRLKNNTGDFSPNWTVSNSTDGRKGDWSIINDTGECVAQGITYQNSSLRSQIAFLYSNTNYTNFEISYTLEDINNVSVSNFHTIWSHIRLNYRTHHDTSPSYYHFLRNNQTGSTNDNTLALKRRRVGTIGSPDDTDILINVSQSYVNPRNVTIRAINNNIKVYVNEILKGNYFDNETDWIEEGAIGFRSPQNELTISVKNISITNFTDINYMLNSTHSWITNKSNHTIDNESGMWFEEDSSTYKLIGSNISKNITLDPTISVDDCNIAEISYNSQNSEFIRSYNSDEWKCTNNELTIPSVTIEPSIYNSQVRNEMNVVYRSGGGGYSPSSGSISCDSNEERYEVLDTSGNPTGIFRCRDKEPLRVPISAKRKTVFDEEIIEQLEEPGKSIAKSLNILTTDIGQVINPNPRIGITLFILVVLIWIYAVNKKRGLKK